MGHPWLGFRWTAAGGGAVQEGGGGRWHGRLRRRGSAWEAAAARLGVGGGEAWRPWEAAAGVLASRTCMGCGAFSFLFCRREGEYIGFFLFHRHSALRMERSEGGVGQDRTHFRRHLSCWLG